MTYSYEDLAGMIDHSLLHPTMTDRELEEGCQLAARYRVVAVCIKPYYVNTAARLLEGSGVRVGTVVGFPHGGHTTAMKAAEARALCDEGAVEIDMVVNIGKVMSGDWSFVEQDIRAVAEASHARGAIVKVIFENDYLTDDATKVRLCEITERAGGDFVKTSTGYGFVKGADGTYSYRGATHHDLKLMRASCSPKVQVKAAGGVRTLDALIAVRDLGVTRCGATTTAAMLDEYRQRAGLPPIESAAVASQTPGY
jgi:deoxyribose-phosphate aldolase